jgi:hypothetical protein
MLIRLTVLLSAICALGLLVAAVVAGGESDPKPEQYLALGSLKVGEHMAQVFFQYPEDDGKRYCVDVAISKPVNAPHIESERLEVWLLAKGGKAATLKDRPHKGPLIEVNTRGATADAIFWFERDAARGDLAAVVVSVDGEFQVFKVPPPKKELSSEG